MARMPNPIGITTNAGPGVTSMMMPISTTVEPITKTTTRRAWRNAALKGLRGTGVSGVITMFGLALLALQFGVVFLHELPQLVAVVQ